MTTYLYLSPRLRMNWAVLLKADSHIACRAHAVPLPCRATKCLECVFPILFTQCGRAWFTLAMPHPCQSMAWARHGKCESAFTYPKRLHHAHRDFGLWLLSTSMMWKSIWFLLLTQAALRATDYCDRFCLTVVYLCLAIWQTYDPPAIRVPTGYRRVFLWG